MFCLDNFINKQPAIHPRTQGAFSFRLGGFTAQSVCEGKKACERGCQQSFTKIMRIIKADFYEANNSLETKYFATKK